MSAPSAAERWGSFVGRWRKAVERRPVLVRVAAFLATTTFLAVTSWPTQSTDLPGRTILVISPIGGAAVAFVLWRDAARRKGKRWKLDRWLFWVERIGSGAFDDDD